MNSLLLQPSLKQLLLFQAQAKLRTFTRRICAPRRLILTFIAFLLGAVWMGQAVLGMLFRPAADPERLITWIPLGFMSYGIWHVLKTTCRKPVEPFEWTPTEVELLGSAPFHRRQLVAYRLTSVGLAATVKALLFSIVMLPDLPSWSLGFCGMLLALVFLDLLRMTLEVATWGCSLRSLVWARGGVISITATCVISALVIVKTSILEIPPLLPALSLIIQFTACLVGLKDTLPGMVMLLPFRTFGNLIMANGSLSELLLYLAIASGTVGGTAWLLVRLDKFFLSQRRERDRTCFAGLIQAAKQFVSKSKNDSTSEVTIPQAYLGAGTILWRQTLGMVHYGPSILFSMIVPGFFSLIPLFAKTLPLDAILQVTGGLVFYSFLLMPSALRFDFRRDVDRMAVLKTLPITSRAMALGQLAAPVIACTLFQMTVLAIAWIFQPYAIQTYLLCVAILIPVNVVIFGLENLIFMYFPYRPNEEGIAVFIRSILTFTAKGLLFCTALVVMLAWIRTAGWLAELCYGGLPVPMTGGPNVPMLTIVWGGIWCLLWAVGAALFALLARVYDQFDPSQDSPPIG